MRSGVEPGDEEIGNEKLIEDNLMVRRYKKNTLPAIDNYIDYLFCIDNIRQG
jgi:hypothetical protein